MLRLVMRATLIAVVLAVGFVLYLIYQEERTPRWPSDTASNTATGGGATGTNARQAPLSPIPTAPNAGAVTPNATTAPPPAAPIPQTQSGAPAQTQAAPQQPASTDPLSEALQRLREGQSTPGQNGTAAPGPGGQLVVTPPPAGTTAAPPGPTAPPAGAPSTIAPPTIAPPTTAPLGTPPSVAPPGAGLAGPPATPDTGTDQSNAGIPLAPPNGSTLGGSQDSGLPPPVPLTPPDAGRTSQSTANLPNATASGTRWGLSGGNGGMSLSIDLGGGQVVHVVVAPQFGGLDRAGMDDRVNWLRDSILSRWGARSGTYIYRRDGSIFRTQ